VQCIRPAGIYRESDPNPDHNEAQLQAAQKFQPPTAWSYKILNGYVDISDLARSIRMCLEAYRDLPAFDVYYINAADTFCLEDSLPFLQRVRPDLRAKVKGEMPGRAAYISTAKARKAFGWEPRHSWTRFLDQAKLNTEAGR
jgi:nucleoside-diphosphate-sugar epimerase